VDNVVYALAVRPVSSLKYGRSGNTAPSHVMAADSEMVSSQSCRCAASAGQLIAEAAEAAERQDAPNACEGPATLAHGSLIRVGCLQFVFSTVVDDHNGQLAATESKSLPGTAAAKKNPSTNDSTYHNQSV